MVDTPAPVVDLDDPRAICEASLDHKIPRKPFDKYIDETLYLVIEDLLREWERIPGCSSDALRHWSKNVRLYTLLRMLGYQIGDRVFKRIEHDQIGDVWLPLNVPILKHLALLPEFNALNFMNAQRHVLSDSRHMNEEGLLRPALKEHYYNQRAHSQTHRYLESAGPHFENLGSIGDGATAKVLRVRHKLSGEEFACKSLPRKNTVKAQREQLMDFMQEIRVLKTTRHHHIVSLIATFTDSKSFALILHPIAENMLHNVLMSEQPLSETDLAILRCSFGCLATALDYLHKNSIRHKDIKPRNILLSQGSVLLCDFGISFQWEPGEGQNGTTSGANNCTRRYAAPEVLGSGTSRNTKTDIWSLGCVFLEIISAMNGYSFDDIDVTQDPETQGLTSVAMTNWLDKIRANQRSVAEALPLDWTLAMIVDDFHERIEAGDLVSAIHEHTTQEGVASLYLASCCRKSSCDTPPRNSVHSDRTSSFSSEPRIRTGSASSEHHAQTSFTSPKWGTPVASSYHPSQYQPSLSQRSQSIRTQTRKGSAGSTSTQPVISRVKQDRVEISDTPSRASSFPSRKSIAPTESLLRYDSAYSRAMETSNRTELDHFPPAGNNIHGTSNPGWEISHSDTCNIQEDEQSIFNESFSSFTFGKSATIEGLVRCCENQENMIQVFESPRPKPNDDHSSPPFTWKVTRRVVVREAIATGERRCSSFWMPLADVHFVLIEATVTLQWSDCNQVQRRDTNDNQQYWSWVYNPDRPNNWITIEFGDRNTARSFLEIIRFPKLAGGSRIDMSSFQEIRTWNIVRSGPKESLLSQTNVEGPISKSRLFVIPQYIDPQITKSSQERHLCVRINNVSRPMYLSNHVEETGRVKNRVAEFSHAKLKSTSLTVLAPLSSDSRSSEIPFAIDSMFRCITGWSLKLFVTAEGLESGKGYMNFKKYGPTDVLLWSTKIKDMTLGRITFRFAGVDESWMSGRISTAVTASTSISSQSKDSSCSFDMFGKQRGCLLNRANMTAVSDFDSKLRDPSVKATPLGFEQECRHMKIQIRDHKNRRKFAELLEELVYQIKKNPKPINASKEIVNRTKPVLHTPLI
ncbi:kinase-like domain-containing protein [Dendryphion nanum]|uniref:non-specific serine/threonine protein kinase n=1 Tax=Dendryphion nanum TaxID=256645 RepID=A0A9P9DX03_9PLEO|nr:kinase-like domain-containing protein [Dendryphion nanum]